MSRKKLSREKRIEVYGSPKPDSRQPSISANGKFFYDPSESQFVKYAPYDKITVQNDSTSDLKLYLDNSEDRVFVVKGGTTRELEGRWFDTYTLEEISGSSVSSGEVVAEVERQGADADTQAREKAKPQNPVKAFVENRTGIRIGDL